MTPHRSAGPGTWRPWRHLAALAAGLAVVLAPVAAVTASGPYTLNVSATGGTLTAASAVDAAGQVVAGTSNGSGGFTLSEPSAGPFTVLGTGTASSGSTAAAVYFGATVPAATYTAAVSLTLPQVMPSEVTAPTGLTLTAGTQQTVPISVYNATYGAVSNGALVALTPSSGLTVTQSGSAEAQVGSSVYAATVSGVVYATLDAASPGNYTLQVTSPPGASLAGGSIPVTVGSPSGGVGSCCSTVSTGPAPSPGSGLGSTVSLDGASGTVVLTDTFQANVAQTLTSSDGAVTLDIPAGAIASSGTVTLQVVEFGSAATTTLLQSSQLASFEQPLGLSFDFTATVNGSAVTTFQAPVTALYSLGPVQSHVSTPAFVDLLRLHADHSLTFTGGKWTGSQVQVPMAGFGPFTLMDVNRTFPDIQGFWAQNDIQLMASKFVVQGYPDGNFYPQVGVTRAQFTTMLLRMLNIPVDTAATTTFTDVRPGSWYYGIVATAAAKGIVQGYSSTSFGPNDLITREQLVTMFVRAMELKGWATPSQASGGITMMNSQFTDAGQVASWAQQDMGIAVADGLVKGRTPTTIVPLGVTTRAEACVWVARLFNRFI